MIAERESLKPNNPMPPKLHKAMNEDTPEAVDVPQTWPAFAVWAATRFGIGIIFLGIVSVATKQVYDDGQVRQDQLMKYVTERNEVDAKRAVADSELARSLAGLQTVITQICDESRRAHKTTAQP